MSKPLIRYPLPLLNNRVIFLELPQNLEQKDIDRICKFLKTLLIEPEEV